MSRASRRANRESAIRAHNVKDVKDGFKRSIANNVSKRDRVTALLDKYVSKQKEEK